MIRNRIAIAIASALFLVLVGTGTGHAYWSSQAKATASVSAGAIEISSTGFSSLKKVYSSSSGGLVVTAPLSVQNTGTIVAPYSMTLGAQVANSLATGAQIRIWSVAAASDCATASVPPSGAATSNWTNSQPLTGNLEPGTSAIHCVRTSLTSAQQTSLAATSMVATLSVTSTLGSWTKSVSATTTQSVADTAAPTSPGTPVASSTTDSQTTLTWAASSDNVGVKAYGIYMGNSYLGFVEGLTATVTGLAVGTTYSFTIVARDTANNDSPASAPVSVTTSSFNSTSWYRIANPNSGLCVDARGASTADGTALITYGCSGALNQQWQFVPTTDGFYKVVPRHAPSLGWDIHNQVNMGLSEGAPAQLWTYGGGTNQQWKIVSKGGGIYNFVNRNSNLCLDVTGISTEPNTQLQQWSCTSPAAQNFTLRKLG